MHSFLGAPVRALGPVFGNIYLTEKRGAAAFIDDDEDALVVLATQAGVAIENARLYAEMQHAQHELRRLEVLEERERIAKELHDGVIQSLFAVGHGPAGRGRDRARRRDLARGSRTPSRRSTARSAICATTSSACGRASWPTASSTRRSRKLGRGVRGAQPACSPSSTSTTSVAAELASRAADVVQLIREALSNVGRHANATTCRVSLRRRAGRRVELEIDDDGVGLRRRRAAHRAWAWRTSEARVARWAATLLDPRAPRATAPRSRARWPA